MGENDKDVTCLICPKKAAIYFLVDVFHRVTVPPRDPEASVAPFGENTTVGLSIGPDSSGPESLRVAMCPLFSTSHILTVLSADAEAMVVPSGENATERTREEWASNVATCSLLATSHGLTVSSPDAEATNAPSGEKETEFTVLVCHSKEAICILVSTSHSLADHCAAGQLPISIVITRSYVDTHLCLLTEGVAWNQSEWKRNLAGDEPFQRGGKMCSAVHYDALCNMDRISLILPMVRRKARITGRPILSDSGQSRLKDSLALYTTPTLRPFSAEGVGEDQKITKPDGPIAI